MTRCWVVSCLAASVLSGAACGHDFEPPDRAERVQRAAVEYTTAAFDTVRWTDNDVRLAWGNAVYAEKCRRCHGTQGRGETDYARERGLDVPSFVEAVTPLAELDELRRTIYVGHASGMPVYGGNGLSPRQVDATAAYILQILLPEVKGTGNDLPL